MAAMLRSALAFVLLGTASALGAQPVTRAVELEKIHSSYAVLEKAEFKLIGAVFALAQQELNAGMRAAKAAAAARANATRANATRAQAQAGAPAGAPGGAPGNL